MPKVVKVRNHPKLSNMLYERSAKNLVAVMIISLMTVGCGSHRVPIPTFVVEQISWSPNGDIAVVSQAQPQDAKLTVIGSDKRKRFVVQRVSNVYGWSEDGRFLLYTKPALGSLGGLNNLSLAAFDDTDTASRVLTDGDSYIVQATWADGAVAYTSPIDFPQEIHANMTVKSLSGQILSSFQAPVGMLPTHLVYDTPQHRFFCGATVSMKPGKSYYYLYTIEGTKFIPIPGTFDYSNIFAYNSAHSFAAVAQCDKLGRLLKIDKLDLSTTPHRWAPF